MMSQHSKHTCKTCLIQFHEAKHALSFGYNSLRPAVFFLSFWNPVSILCPALGPSITHYTKTFLTDQRPGEIKPLPIIASLFTETAGSDWLSHLSFYCFVSMVERKVWLLLMSGNHNNHEFWPALLILPVVFIIIISSFPLFVSR